MDITLVVIGTILGFLAIIGCFLPIIPGLLLAYIPLLFLKYLDSSYISTQTLTIWLIVIILATILDYFIPILGSKKLGGTKRGSRGATIGMIFSIIILPLLSISIGPFGIIGIIGLPFVGAYIGELLHNKKNALKSAIGTFLGFITGTIIKLIISIMLLIPFFQKSITIIKGYFS